MSGTNFTEIERKYLLKSEAWRDLTDGPGMLIRQAYLARGACTVRVRVRGDEAWITVKGSRVGASRPEFEYPIPCGDAARMLELLCEKPVIEKTRHLVKAGGCVFEIDEFLGANAGLVMAEVELASEDQAVELPDWIGEEVTEDARYYNSNLVRRPYSLWGGKG
jgi:CYTH domain-containing protein